MEEAEEEEEAEEAEEAEEEEEAEEAEEAEKAEEEEEEEGKKITRNIEKWKHQTKRWRSVRLSLPATQQKLRSRDQYRNNHYRRHGNCSENRCLGSQNRLFFLLPLQGLTL